jgi:hypothetical protein
MADKQHKGGDMTVKEAGHLGGQKVQHERDLRDRKEVRHEAYDKPGPAKGEAYGIAAITRALEGVGFPATKDALLKRAGNQQIEYRKGQPVNLRRIIEDLEDAEYPSMANVIHSVSEALKEEGLSHRGEQEGEPTQP